MAASHTRHGSAGADAPLGGPGLFLNALIAFLLVAAAIYFFVLNPMNALEARRQAGAEEAPTTKTCIECASEIPVAARRCPMCTQPQPGAATSAS